MYKWVIKKLEQDNEISKKEKARRRANIVAFWEQEGEKYNRLLDKLFAQNGDYLFDEIFLYLGYWARFKLLYDGEEPTFDNIVSKWLDIYKIRIFINEIFDMMDIH